MENLVIRKLRFLLQEAKKDSRSGEVVELELVLKKATGMVHALKGVVADVEYCETCLCGLWDEDSGIGELLDKMKKECDDAVA